MPLVQSPSTSPSSGTNTNTNAPNFDAAHPVYARYVDRWRMAFDFWKGGLSVLQPSWTVQAGVSLPTWVTESGEGADTVAKKILSSQSRGINSYLWPDSSETDEEYSQRHKRQIHLPLFSAVVNAFVNGILRVGCKRDAPVEWEEFCANVDGVGTDVDSFMRQAEALAISFGRVHAIVDRPPATEAIKTRADERRAGVRACAYLVTPMDLIDWSVDEWGRWRWVAIREPQPDARQPGTPFPTSAGIAQVRVWFPEYWDLYRTQSATSGAPWTKVESGPHDAGEVPLATCWAARDSRARTMDCESPLADVLDMDRHFLNKLSELDEVDRAQAFALLAIPEQDGGPPGPIDVSPWRAMSVPMGGMPQFLSPDSSLSTGKWARLQDGLWLTRQLAGVGRGRAEQSKEERSGDAIALESDEKTSQMCQWAASLEKFDRDVFRFAGALDRREDAPRAEYPRNYDLKGTLREINEILQIKSTNVVPPLAVVELVRPILARMLRDHGIAESEQKKVLDLLAPVTDPVGKLSGPPTSADEEDEPPSPDADESRAGETSTESDPS